MDNHKIDAVQLNQERKKSVELYLEALTRREDPNVDLAASASKPVRLSRWIGRKYKQTFGAWNHETPPLRLQEEPYPILNSSSPKLVRETSERKLESSEDLSSIESKELGQDSSLDGNFSLPIHTDSIQQGERLQGPEAILSSIYKKIPSPRLAKRKFPFTVNDAYIIKAKTEEYIFAMTQAKEKIVSSLEAKNKMRDSLRLTLKPPGTLRRPSSLFFGDQYSLDVEAILHKDLLHEARHFLSDDLIQRSQIEDIQKAIEYAEQHASILEKFIEQDPSSQEAIYYALDLYEEAALVALRRELHAYQKKLGLEAQEHLSDFLGEQEYPPDLAGKLNGVVFSESQVRREIYDLKLSFNNLPIDMKTQVIGSAKTKMEEVLGRNEFFRGLNVKTKLKNAQVYCLNTRPWDVIENAVHIFLNKKEWALKSLIIPAKKLGNIFEETYECQGVCSHTISENVHAVNLAKTALIGPEGELWFEAYRHGVHCAYGIENPQARLQANINRAVETVQAMVVGDTFILENAKSYTADHPLLLDILSINLQTGDRVRSMSAPILGNLYNERLHIEEQAKAWSVISDKIHEVKYYDETGKLQSLFVQPSVHAVNFGVNSIALEGLGAFGSQSRVLGSWKNNSAMNQEAMEWLFGENYSLAMMGKVGDFLNNSFIRNEKLKQNVQALAMQVLDIYKRGAYASTGNEPYKIVTRLAYMSYLMGMKVAFNCKSGKDRTGMMDVEMKFLVARAHAENAIPLPDEPLSQEYQEALYTLAVFSGNHEMQKMNTGIAGYKADNSQTIHRLGGEWVTSYLRGPSAFVSA